jgi:hypothetical protein
MKFLKTGLPSLAFLTVVVVLLSTSCSNIFNFGPSISELTTTSGFVSAYQPIDKTNSFYIDSPQICMSAKINGASRNTEIQVDWVYVQGDMSKEAKSLIDTDKVHCDTDCYFGFTLMPPPGGFISGEYKTNILVNGKQKAEYTFYIRRDQAGPTPQIKSFAASPLSLTEGDPLTLSWAVTNASRVEILPSPGQVKAEGTLTLNPASDTTYVLWAVNRSGTSSNSLSVKVARQAKGRANLIITEFWNTGNILFYNIKNTGDLASMACQSYLYKNDLLVSQDYVPPLDPGAERVESFSQYHFSPRFPSILGGSVTEATTDAVTMRICLNGDLACPELAGASNCMEHNFGPLLEVHLGHYAGAAQWLSSTGALSWPMMRDSNGGWAQLGSAQMDDGESYPDSIIMTLPITSNSWMQARVGVPQGYPAVLQPFTIPHKCKLSADVGLTRDVPAAATAKFILGTAQGSDITYYPPVIINTRGKPVTYEVDLSKLAGKQIQFIFRVESSEPLQQGSAVWIDPTLTQER